MMTTNNESKRSSIKRTSYFEKKRNRKQYDNENNDQLSHNNNNRNNIGVASSNNNTKRVRGRTLNDITTTTNHTENIRKHFSNPSPQKRHKNNGDINENIIISKQSQISFYIDHIKKPKNVKEIKTKLHITGTMLSNGTINIFYQFPTFNKLNMIQKKPHKITPNWLIGQRENIAKQILHHLFNVSYQGIFTLFFNLFYQTKTISFSPKSEIENTDKKIILQRLFNKLGFNKAQQEIVKSKSYKFELWELKQIQVCAFTQKNCLFSFLF